MYNASMKQDVVEKKANYPTELTEMQRRFCEYLLFNEGRTTGKEAAIKAGYAEKNARFEAHGLMQNPKIRRYLQVRSNEINRSYAVTKNNYVRRQQVLSQTLVDQGKIEKALGFENLIGKAEKLEEIKRIKQLQKDRIEAATIDHDPIEAEEVKEIKPIKIKGKKKVTIN